MGSKKAVATIFVSVLPILFLIVGALLPSKAAACGIFDILSCFDILTDSSKKNVVQNNSQSVATALQAVNSPTPPEKNDKSISIVDKSSLSSLGDSFGDDADISSDQISLYVVHSGDTLPAIAKMFGVTTNTIIWANEIKNGKVQIGDTLVILPITGISHTVKAGETIQSIAKQHKGDLSEIMAYNNLTKDSKLSVGDVIIVPDGEISPSSSSGKSSSGKYSNAGVGTKGSTNPSYEGYYMRPLLGGVKTQGIHGHNAVDIASSYGTNIMATASGTVILAKSGGWNGGYGSYVVVSHPNGTQTLYAHLSEVSVSVGDDVSQGQTVGKMGATGHATGVHLHFEIRGAKNPF